MDENGPSHEAPRNQSTQQHSSIMKLHIHRSLLALAIVTCYLVQADPIERECDSTNATCFQAWHQHFDTPQHRYLSTPGDQHDSSCSNQGALLLTSDCKYGPWDQLELILQQVQQVFGQTTCQSFQGDKPTYADMKAFNYIVVEAGAQVWGNLEPWMDARGREALEQLASEGHGILLNGAGWGWPYYMQALFNASFSSTFLYNFQGTIVESKLLQGLGSDTVQGNAFAHGSIQYPDEDFEPLIVNGDNVLLVRGTDDHGSRNVMIGSMSTTNFHSPQSEATRLRLLVLQGLCEQANRPPVALCTETVILPANSNCAASVTALDVDNGSSDPNGDMIHMSIDFSGALFVGESKLVTLTVTDSHGKSDSCQSTVMARDTAPLLIEHIDCGERGVVSTCEKTSMFQVSGLTKENGCPVSIDSAFDRCVFCDGTGEKKTRPGCQVSVLDKNTYEISNPSGPGTHLVFSIIASDINGNTVERKCSMCVESGEECGGNLRHPVKLAYQCNKTFPYDSLKC